MNKRKLILSLLYITEILIIDIFYKRQKYIIVELYYVQKQIIIFKLFQPIE